jgi:hypothetical protein
MNQSSPWSSNAEKGGPSLMKIKKPTFSPYSQFVPGRQYRGVRLMAVRLRSKKNRDEKWHGSSNQLLTFGRIS